MDANNNQGASRPVLCLHRTLLLLTCLTAPLASATLITFDDLTQNTCVSDPENSFCDPLSVNDQYGDLGVHFSGAALIVAPPGNEAIVSPPTDGNRGLDVPAPDYSPRQPVSFAGIEITRIHLIDLYERRGFLGFDNLSFTRDTTSVPEPSTLVLIVGGLLASLFARSIAPRRFL